MSGEIVLATIEHSTRTPDLGADFARIVDGLAASLLFGFFHCDPAPGDVVRLKSGGPKMTVCSTGPGRYVNCSFFNTYDEAQEVDLPFAAIQHAD